MIGDWWYDIDSDNILNCPRSNYYFLTQLNQLLDNTTSKCLSISIVISEVFQSICLYWTIFYILSTASLIS